MFFLTPPFPYPPKSVEVMGKVKYSRNMFPGLPAKRMKECGDVTLSFAQHRPARLLGRVRVGREMNRVQVTVNNDFIH